MLTWVTIIVRPPTGPCASPVKIMAPPQFKTRPVLPEEVLLDCLTMQNGWLRSMGKSWQVVWAATACCCGRGKGLVARVTSGQSTQGLALLASYLLCISNWNLLIENWTRSWAFRSGSTVSWALSITSLIIVLPLILEVRWDFALADQEKYFELQQKGYTHQQIEQMMGRTIPTGPPAAA